MPYHNRMADLTMRDMHRLHLAHKRLEAVFHAITATSVQGKPAMIHLINEADGEIEALFRKGVLGVLNHARRGKLPGGYDEPEFIEHLQAVMETIASDANGASEAQAATSDAPDAEPTDAGERLFAAESKSVEPIHEAK